jgi:hypothetical protein
MSGVKGELFTQARRRLNGLQRCFRVVLQQGAGPDLMQHTSCTHLSRCPSGTLMLFVKRFGKRVWLNFMPYAKFM